MCSLLNGFFPIFNKVAKFSRHYFVLCRQIPRCVEIVRCLSALHVSSGCYVCSRSTRCYENSRRETSHREALLNIPFIMHARLLKFCKISLFPCIRSELFLRRVLKGILRNVLMFDKTKFLFLNKLRAIISHYRR